jgi:hypothetical protein
MSLVCGPELLLEGTRCRKTKFANGISEALNWLAEFDPDGRCELKIEPELLPQWFKRWILPHGI